MPGCFILGEWNTLVIPIITTLKWHWSHNATEYLTYHCFPSTEDKSYRTTSFYHDKVIVGKCNSSHYFKIFRMLLLRKCSITLPGELSVTRKVRESKKSTGAFANLHGRHFQWYTDSSSTMPCNRKNHCYGQDTVLLTVLEYCYNPKSLCSCKNTFTYMYTRIVCFRGFFIYSRMLSRKCRLLWCLMYYNKARIQLPRRK